MNAFDAVHTPWIPVCGVAVLPSQAGPLVGHRLRTVYSQLDHPSGQMFTKIMTVPVSAGLVHHVSDMTLLKLRVVVFMLEEQNRYFV